jgi:hypothetical protein
MLTSRVHRAVGFGPVGVLATLHFLFSQVDPEAADDFFDRLVSGAELSRGEAVLHLRNRFPKEQRKPRPDRLKPPEAAHLTIVAFNHRRGGKEVMKLRARFSDPFPVILPIGLIERQRSSGHLRHRGTEPDETVSIWDRVRAFVDASPEPVGPDEVASRLDPRPSGPPLTPASGATPEKGG